jgi:hypothetical protein
MLGDILREKQTRVLQFIEDQKKEFLSRLESAVREAQTGAAASTEAERRDARTRLKVVEQRARDLQTTQQQLVKLRQTFIELAAKARTSLRSAAVTDTRAG